MIDDFLDDLAAAVTTVSLFTITPFSCSLIRCYLPSLYLELMSPWGVMAAGHCHSQ
jgi:hypothetical protein